MIDLPTHAGVDVVPTEIIGPHEPHEPDTVGLVVDSGFTTDGASDVGVLVLLTDRTVGVRDDVPGSV
ncbi:MULTISPECIES: hypothetical protein [unclassified Streptomyces]|uniref:hypothetical protein n=1 Tax=Streptomyces sp. AmelKG-E11A TaxID=1100822 RepID=UPI001F36A65F|nr:MULTISPECIES: hypothetical protein [unclassified Streptomyces]